MILCSCLWSSLVIFRALSYSYCHVLIPYLDSGSEVEPVDYHLTWTWPRIYITPVLYWSLTTKVNY
ncbi:hypothetical protein BJV74DRAFT_546433 [Russula compacta]|nr:hypothetical protein BJV74DRAFT_546433 [Russula compacta]